MKFKSLIIIFLQLFFIRFLFSGGTFNWELDNYHQFNKGEFNKIKLSEEGFLTLSPDFHKLAELDAMFVWDIKEDSKGNIYLATGNDGIIYKMNKKGELKPFFNTSSIAAFKLLIDKNDNIYAATLTRGLIYKITPDGKGSVFKIFDGDYIWDMKFYKNKILLATGTPGCLFELNLNTKKLNEIALTKEMHITCLDTDKKGNIYFGTSDKGTIYKISTGGNIRVIYQTEQKEVHSLVIDKISGIIYAGTSDKEFNLIKIKNNKIQPYKQEIPKPKNLFDDLKDFKKLKPPANAVYEIKENKYINKIIESKDSTFLSLLLDNRTLYIGSGDNGNIYQYKNKKIEKLAQLEEQQILSFHQLKNRKIIIGTGNIGNIYYLDKKLAGKGDYISDIFDANAWAFWGKIQWDEKTPQGTEITFQTRTGNVEDIDDTWSDWSRNYVYSKGSQITSPPARFLQFKINLETEKKFKTPEVFSVKIPYLIKNRQPEVLSIKFLKKESNDKAKNKTDKKSFKKYGLKIFELKIEWEAKDSDKDELLYSVCCKLRNENKWILLKKDLSETSYKFDTRILPDGIYLFKIIADDIPSNSISNHLLKELISKPFIIDNTPPIVAFDYKKKKKDEYMISGKVRDKLSSIASVSFSVDTKKWISVFPIDLIFDSREEQFQFPYKYQEGIIIIKAEDDAGNITTSHIKIFR